MKAIVQEAYGSADVLRLRDVEVPEIGDGEVLVRVHAAGFEPGVWHVMTGLPYLVRVMGYGLRRPKVGVRGNDVAGSVEAVGKDVTRFRPGDKVFGVCHGAFAEYARASEEKLAPKPANLTLEQAATIPVSALTALQGLRDKGRVQPGQQVLVLGAAGGVGSFAVQIAKALGAEVTGVCSTNKTDLVRALGADQVIDYTRDEVTDGRRRWDLILDTAGNRPLSKLRRALTPEGTLVIIGGEGGGRWLGAMTRVLGALALSPLVRQRLRFMIAEARQEDLELLKELAEAGKLAPLLDRTFPLSQVPDAVRYWEAGRARGKVVIAVREQENGRPERQA